MTNKPQSPFGSLFLAGLLCLGASSPSPADNGNQDDYLKLVNSYADALIGRGRDVYGEMQSPLFAVALDRKTERLPEGEVLRRILGIPRTSWGIRPDDRILAGANPMLDENLYQVLYALTGITGDQRYAAEADRALQWFFEHCQSPATGLLAWGEHMGWDFHDEKPIRDIHEFARPWVLWDRSFKLAPEACRRFATGLWQHQIADQRTGEFSRHAAYSRHGAGVGYEFPRHGGFYIAAWAASYQDCKDPELLRAIEVMVDSFEKRRNPTSGAIPAGTSRDIERVWPHSNLSLAIDLSDSAPKVPRWLAEKMQTCASRTDEVFLVKTKHDLSDPRGKGFLISAQASSLTPNPLPGHRAYTDTWAAGYGDSTDARIAMLCLLRYGQTRRDGYQELARAAADRYLEKQPDAGDSVHPTVFADVILLLVSMHELTGQERYLAGADNYARQALGLFFDKGTPLPKATTKLDHYEAITGADTLMMGLLKLWLVKSRSKVKIPIIYCDR